MILRTKHGTGWHEQHVRATDGVPHKGDVIDDGGQYYYTVLGVHWAHRGFWRPRLEAIVVLREHDRAEEAYDAC